jgi:hypothetical protein
MTLSDTQLLILSAASQRTDHAAVLPANLKGSAAKKVIDKLLNEKLLQELRAKDDMPVWRRGDDNRPYTLRITKAGLRAIEVEDVAGALDNSATTDPDEVAAVSTEAKLSERPSRAKRSGAKKAATVRPHGHRTWMYRRFPKAITNFKVREVFPPFRFSQPFSTVCMVKHSALAAQPFHITTAC